MAQISKKLVPTDLNSEVNPTFNSDIAELLGFTREYLNTVSGTILPDSIILLANEVAITSAKLNLLCTKFDKLLTTAKILEVHRKQIEWAEMVAARRAERTAKERVKIAKKLKGMDRKIYAATGELPHEYESRLMEAFKAFMMAGMEKP